MPRIYRLMILFCVVFAFYGRAMPMAQEKVVEVEAISCWWRLDKTSVRVGEPFNVFLTCRVVETRDALAVPDESPLDPSAVSLPPLELISGERYHDIRRDSLRFFQYRYRFKFLEGGFFGKELEIPYLDIPYRLETASLQGEKTVGEPQTYRLPPLKLRVESLVPRETSDIRDASGVTFGDSGALRFQAKIAFLVGGFLILLSALTLFHLAFLGARDRGRKKVERGVPPLGNTDVLRGSIRGLKKVRRAVKKSGWGQESIGRTVSLLRIIGALLISGYTKQQMAALGARSLEGQTRMKKHPFSLKTVLVSSSVTVGTVKGYLLDKGLMTSLNLEFLAAFERFSAARSNPEETTRFEGLDESLARAIRFARIFRLKRLWIARAWSRGVSLAKGAGRRWRA